MLLEARGVSKAFDGFFAVRGVDFEVAIDLHVVVEYGLNLAEVASNVGNRGAYEV